MQRPPRADEERDEPEEPQRTPSLLSARELQVATPARNPATNVEPADDEDEPPAKAAPKQRKKR